MDGNIFLSGYGIPPFSIYDSALPHFSRLTHHLCHLTTFQALAERNEDRPDFKGASNCIDLLASRASLTTNKILDSYPVHPMDNDPNLPDNPFTDNRKRKPPRWWKPHFPSFCFIQKSYETTQRHLAILSGSVRFNDRLCAAGIHPQRGCECAGCHQQFGKEDAAHFFFDCLSMETHRRPYLEAIEG